MSRTFHNGERRIRARGIRHDPPDLRRLARVFIALAQAQAEAEAQTGGDKPAGKPTKNRPGAKASGGAGKAR